MNEQQPDVGEGQKKKRPIPWAAIGIAALIAILCGSSLAKGDGEPEDQTIQAQGHCYDWVKEKLKAPATADLATTSTVGSGEGPWTFTGTVDSENSFGAKIRNQWECKISLANGMFTGQSRAY